MKRNGALLAGLAVALLAVAILVIVKLDANRAAELPAKNTQPDAAATQTREVTSSAEKSPALTPLPGAAGVVLPNLTTQAVSELIVQPLNVKTQKVAQAQKPKKEKVIQDPLARDALALVGVDLEAEMYWFGAIHDPALPKSERQDLIDDLNEDGLPDPKHPTADDLPLLLSRLEILEDLVPSLSDEFDWKESYDDLLNLVDLAMGSGKPVQ